MGPLEEGGVNHWPLPYLHSRRGRVSPDHHLQFLGVGEQSTHGLLVGCMTEVDPVHLQDPVTHAQTAARGQTTGNDLPKGNKGK